jgi:hypothetical protein
LSGAQASVSAAPGIVEDATGFCSDAAPLPNRRQENRRRTSFLDYYRNGRNAMSTQIRRRSAPRWCVLAGQSVGIALAQCCDWPVL